MKEYLENKKIIILIIGLIICLIGVLIFYAFNNNEVEVKELSITTKKEVVKVDNFFVDIKGNVNNPGVYEFTSGDRVIDAIEVAGGLTKNANTNNINLSKKLTSEMVIYVYSNKEVKNNDNLSCNNICDVEVIEVNNCIEKNNVENTNLINLNKATLEDLLTLTGIGESKAKSIIEYRDTNGKFKDINELKNVSGIGDALFEKIKDKISV